MNLWQAPRAGQTPGIACSNAQAHTLTSGTTSAPFGEGVTSDTFGIFKNCGGKNVCFEFVLQQI
jgi:hypothetical protein